MRILYVIRVYKYISFIIICKFTQYNIRNIAANLKMYTCIYYIIYLSTSAINLFYYRLLSVINFPQQPTIIYITKCKYYNNVYYVRLWRVPICLLLSKIIKTALIKCRFPANQSNYIYTYIYICSNIRAYT